MRNGELRKGHHPYLEQFSPVFRSSLAVDGATDVWGERGGRV